MLRKKKGQTIAEWAILFTVVISAALAMQIYVKRGLQARMKSGTDAYTSVSQDIEIDGKTATLNALSQYEPYYAESTYERYQENIEQEHMGSGKIVKEKVSDITAAKAGGYEMEAAGKTTREKRDKIWEEGTGDGT
jgi:hypothetical protein